MKPEHRAAAGGTSPVASHSATLGNPLEACSEPNGWATLAAAGAAGAAAAGAAASGSLHGSSVVHRMGCPCTEVAATVEQLQMIVFLYMGSTEEHESNQRA